jgi:hypothetical protein
VRLLVGVLAAIHGGKQRWFRPGRITPERLEEVLRVKLPDCDLLAERTRKNPTR